MGSRVLLIMFVVLVTVGFLWDEVCKACRFFVGTEMCDREDIFKVSSGFVLKLKLLSLSIILSVPTLI